MALTLGGTLLAAQTSMNRKPLVELYVGSLLPDIPFDGALINTLEVLPAGYAGYEELRPDAKVLASGELVYVSLYGFWANVPVSNWPMFSFVRLVYTTGERSEFHTVDIDYGGSNYLQADDPPYYWAPYHNLSEPSVVELADGNLGIMFFRTQQLGAKTNLSYGIVSPTGTKINPATTRGANIIFEITPATEFPLWERGPHVIRLQDGTYFAVFVLKESGNYNMYKVTSSNFTSWAGRVSIPIAGGLTGEKSNPFIQQLANGHLMCWFDHVDYTDGPNELRNIYYVLSTDGGANWGNPVKVTNYTGVGQIGAHPYVVETSPGNIRLVYDDLSGVLHTYDASANWDLTYSNGTSNDMVEALLFDPVNRNLYAVCQWTKAGNKSFMGVAQIDGDTMEVLDTWHKDSVPAFNLGMFDPYGYTWWENTHNDGWLTVIPWGQFSHFFSLLDGEANTIKLFAFESSAEFSITKNVTGWDGYKDHTKKAWLDSVANRLYLLSWKQEPFITSPAQLSVGYIDLDQTGPDYQFTVIFDAFPSHAIGQEEAIGIAYGDFLVCPAEDAIIITTVGNMSGYGDTGGMYVYQLSTGAERKAYSYDNNAGMPIYGIKKIVYNPETYKFYGTFVYVATFGEQDKRGIVEIDLMFDTFVYIRPTYDTVDDYGLGRAIAIGNGELLYTGPTGKVVIFNGLTNVWTMYDGSNVPGLPTTGIGWMGIAYDSLNRIIFVGGQASVGGTGVYAFSRDGYIAHAYYMDAEYTTQWDWTAGDVFLQGSRESHTAVAYAGASWYAFWENGLTNGERTLWWDSDSGYRNLGDYVLAGTEISIKRSIDGSPNRLEFTVAKGHLFDPTNLGSIYSQYLKKNRKIDVRWGEEVSGAPYWQDAGTFIVTETKVTKGSGRYPTMRVVAEDIRAVFEDQDVIATPYYEGEYPETLISNFLQDFANLDASDITMPTMDGREVLYAQWLDSTVKKVVEEVLQIFGYYPCITVANKFSARKIAEDNPVDNTYTGTDWLFEWSPDDSFSDYTNRVVVIGESHDFIEVLHDEESLQAIHGTVGWWGHKKTIKVYYSDDRQKQCRDPRLEILESVTNFNFRLGGGGEAITAIADDETWVEITIEMPNLVAVVISLTGATIALGISAAGHVFTPGWITCAIAINVVLLFYIVASLANYQYNILARPVGQERLQLQGQADDLELQAEIGRIVTKKIDEPLCNTVPSCNRYAGLELMIARLQRKRLKIKKVAHLQDEEGDTISLPHPTSGADIKIFITDITRKMVVPESPGGEDDGFFVDEIEGWVL